MRQELTFEHGTLFLSLIIIIMALQPYVEPWPPFQFVEPTHSR
jgi:hypothetical protein